MNILFVTHAPPDEPQDGSRLIVHHLARELSTQHRLYLASLSTNAIALPTNRTRLLEWFTDMRIVRKPEESRTRKWAGNTAQDEPLWVHAYNVPALRDEILTLLRAYPIDVVHCDTGMMAQYVDALPNIPRIVAPHDSLTRALELHAIQAPRWMERFAARMQVSKMRRYEQRAYADFARVVVVTASERAFLQSIAPSLAVSVAANGVDANYFSPVPPQPHANSIGFVGMMNYAPNQAAVLYFVRNVLPRIWSEMPDVSFTIIGRDPTRQIRALAKDTRIQVTGTVDDVRPLLAAQSIVVCPMREPGGIKNKMLEALAMGKAIVATPQAAEGLDIRDGVEVLLCQDTTAFADACLRAMCDPALRVQLGGAARAWAVRRPWSSTASSISRSMTKRAEHLGDRRVLLVEHKTVLGGGQVALLNIAGEWKRTRAPIHPLLVCPPNAEIVFRARALPLDVMPFDLGAIDRTRGVTWNLAQRLGPTARLSRTMRQAHTEVVLANGAYSFLASVLAAKLARVPILWLEHNTTLPNDNTVRHMIQWADRIVVVSEAIRAQFVRLVPEAQSKLALIYNGVDVDKFRASRRAARDEVRDALGLAHNAYVIGIVSRLAPEKGVDYFVAAAARIAAEKSNVEFLVVGEGGEREPLQAQAKEMGLGERIRFVGFQENVPVYLAAMDVALFPFLAEGFPLAVLEAMAAGLPVVATDVGGVREQIVAGETGTIVPPRNVEHMARAVLELLNDETKQRAFGECGRARVGKHFTLARQAAELGSLLWLTKNGSHAPT